MQTAAEQRVTETFANSAIHDEWARAYRTPDNGRFFEGVFDRLAQLLNAPADATILDAGCGTCAHAIRLARRGFRVVAVDVSAQALHTGAERVAEEDLSDRIRTQQASLLSLPFADGSFSYVLCWGVLMHVPQVEQAIAELARVLRRGGTLIVSEGNMASLQSRLRRWVKPAAHVKMRRTPAGLEYWRASADGMLLTREASIEWLIGAFARHDVALTLRLTGQLTELYTKTAWPLLRRLIHGANRVWATSIRWPQPAFGNILLFERK